MDTLSRLVAEPGARLPPLGPLLDDLPVLEQGIRDEFPDRAGEALASLFQHVLQRAEGVGSKTPLSLSAADHEPIHGHPPLHRRQPTDELTRALQNGIQSQIVRASDTLACWAQARLKRRTAMAFVQAALRLAPDDVTLQRRAGQLAKWRADPRASAWLERAIHLGESYESWGDLARSWLLVGNILREQHRNEEAAKVYAHAIRFARQAKLRSVEGEFLHSHAVVCFRMLQTEDALNHADEALAAYGQHRARVAELANDIGWFWMHQEGEFARALEIFRAVLHDVEGPFSQVFVLASLARAAGGAGKESEYTWAAGKFWKQLPMLPDTHGQAAALIDIARGAKMLYRVEEARRAALQAQVIATERSEQWWAREASSVLDSLRGQRVATERPQSVRNLSVDLQVRETRFANRLLNMLKIGKLDGPLTQMANSQNLKSDEVLWVEVECDPEDADLVRGSVLELGGSITEVVDEPGTVGVYTKLPRSRIMNLAGEALVKHIALVKWFTVS